MTFGSNYFRYVDGQLCAEDCALEALAQRFDTPLYVYSGRAFRDGFQAYREALNDHAQLICYSVKANSNGALLQLLAEQGAGFDVVSGGELLQVLRNGGAADKIVFSGVGKTEAELELAVRSQIHGIHVESEAELDLLEKLAVRLGMRAPVAVRIHPQVGAGAHPHIVTGAADSKFGVTGQEAVALLQRAAHSDHLQAVGIACHIGSQITDIQPLLQAFEELLHVARQLQDCGIELRYLDLGGGLGIRYRDGEEITAPGQLIGELKPRLLDSGLRLILEPGRSIAAPAGVLLTRVLYVKQREEHRFIIVDAGMNDLLRPALYQAEHPILPVRQTAADEPLSASVVGPVCESGDLLGRHCRLAVSAGDLLAIGMAGAYGACMASNYNARLRPAEVLAERDEARLIRRRESYEDLWRLECEEEP